jgi:transcription initiation factor TFIIIB Brf1 subunit/transcription initiation factor TFIIB
MNQCPKCGQYCIPTNRCPKCSEISCHKCGIVYKNKIYCRDHPPEE